MKSKTFFICCLISTSVLLFSFTPDEGLKQYFNVITTYLDTKPYNGNKYKFTENDLTVPQEVVDALNVIGVSHYTLLRNEMFARHGYVFKTEILAYIYSTAKWYKPDPKVDLTYLSKLESANVNYIKSIEDVYDFENIAQWMDEKGYFGDTELYINESNYNVPADIILSLNHIRINPSRLLRNEIFARKGYIFADKNLDKIFSLTTWYSKKSENIKEITSSMDKIEFLNIELLKKREWIDILGSVNFSVPNDVIYIPTIGYNAMYIKILDYNGQKYYYSSQFVWPVLTRKNNIFDPHNTNTDELVAKEIIQLIKKESDPLKKLIIFFENKKYKDYADKTVFNKSDMKTPSYLKQAVEKYGLDWNIILRKEIHARNGAIFTDKKAKAIFSTCSWYKAKYNLNTSSISRFPSSVQISEPELINFALLEGEELAGKYYKYKDKNIVVDLNGNTFFIKKDKIYLGYGSEFQTAHGFDNIEDYETKSLLEIIQGIIKSYNFNLDQYFEQENIYAGSGC